MATNVGGLTSSSSSGIDVSSTVEQLMYIERAPERMMQKQQALIDAQKSALQDLQTKLNALEDSVLQLKDFSGPLSSRVASSSDSSVFTVTADQSAEIGSHTITVERLATTSTTYTDPIAADTIVSGDMVLRIGAAEPVTISLGGTLASAAQQINELSVGVRAQVITDSAGTRLALISSKSGSAGAMVVESGPEALKFNTGETGEDAKVTIDGIPFLSADNSISGVMPGLTLQLQSAEPGKQLKLQVSSDTGRAKQAITRFVDGYNILIKTVGAQFVYNEGTKSAGVLAGDASVRGLQASLLSAMSYSAGEGAVVATLRGLGIDMQNDGTLKVDSEKLTKVLESDRAAVLEFFQGDAGVGFANKLGSELNRLTDSIEGPIAADIKGLDDSRRSLSDSIDELEVRLQARQEILTAQYTRLNTLLQQFTLSQQQMTTLFGMTKK